MKEKNNVKRLAIIQRRCSVGVGNSKVLAKKECFAIPLIRTTFRLALQQTQKQKETESETDPHRKLCFKSPRFHHSSLPMVENAASSAAAAAIYNSTAVPARK